MDDPDKKIRDELASVSRVSREIGTFVSTDGVRAMVDFGGGRVPADFAGYLPAVNESVFILRVDGALTIIGPTTMKPDQGTVVTAPTDDRVTVSTDIGDVSCIYPSGLTLSSGQQVKLFWQGDFGFVLDVMSTTPDPPAPPPAPEPPPSSGGSQIFTAIQSGSHNGSRWYTGQVISADSSLGIWAYGTKIRDTIPAGVTTKTLEIWISIAQVNVGAPINFAAHGYGTVDNAPAPSFATSFAATPGGSGWLSLDPNLGNFLNAGGGYLGVGVNHGGWWFLNDLNADSMSGALRITW